MSDEHKSATPDPREHEGRKHATRYEQSSAWRPSGGGSDGASGVREPRNPRPDAGSGEASAEAPDDPTV